MKGCAYLMAGFFGTLLLFFTAQLINKKCCSEPPPGCTKLMPGQWVCPQRPYWERKYH